MQPTMTNRTAPVGVVSGRIKEPLKASRILCKREAYARLGRCSHDVRGNDTWKGSGAFALTSRHYTWTRARAFYEGTLGLVRGAAHGDWTEYDLPGGGCLLLGPAKDLQPSARAGGRVAFEVSDLDALVVRLRRAGRPVHRRNATHTGLPDDRGAGLGGKLSYPSRTEEEIGPGYPGG